MTFTPGSRIVALELENVADTLVSGASAGDMDSGLVQDSSLGPKLSPRKCRCRSKTDSQLKLPDTRVIYVTICGDSEST
jgi:hypothetical protein